MALRYRWAEVQKHEVLVPGRESLRSLSAIKGVWVSVSPDVADCGLSPQAVKTLVELQLRRNGVEFHDMPADPNEFSRWIKSNTEQYKKWIQAHPGEMFNMDSLSVSIESISFAQTDIVAASVTVWQSQLVNLLSASTPTTMIATTWDQSQHVLGQRSDMASGCRDAINEMLEKYCNDWLATHSGSKIPLPRESLDRESTKKND